jgi:hypothetical protein
MQKIIKVLLSVHVTPTTDTIYRLVKEFEGTSVCVCVCVCVCVREREREINVKRGANAADLFLWKNLSIQQRGQKGKGKVVSVLN